MSKAQITIRHPAPEATRAERTKTMKKILNNRVYNTDTATLIGSKNNGNLGSDFNYRCDSLYRKRTGEYFLHGEGGARTQYAEWHNGLLCGGERIIPLTFDAARLWAEENLDADIYEAEFGEVVEDNSRICVSLSLSAAGVERARREASARSVSLSALIDEYFATL